MSVVRRVTVHLVLLMFLLVPYAGVFGNVEAQEEPAETNDPLDIWSKDYIDDVYPWGGDDAAQFKEYHTYFTMKDRMQYLAENNRNIMTFHEGLNGGENARGQTTTANTYEGWYYNHRSPWLKITVNPQGGECNDFVGDCGNYEDRPDVLLVGNHHAREWMSYEVPMMFLEMVAHYYGKAGVDNDGDGLIDEDPYGDADGDGIIDDDGDCLSLNASFQDSNGDGTPCGPGDHGVDEDISEQWITDLVNTREIYLVPMLNVDGNRYDREVYCGEQAWETCPTSGWRKNLRDNTFDDLGPFPDMFEEVDEDCDGVDLNRNYQYEWGVPLGATVPVVPGTCSPQGGLDGTNNDVYTGPHDTNDDDGDGLLNEDHVDGVDDDQDGLVDEDWLGGNSEPETKFIQDLTEMNDDNGDGGSEFKLVFNWHSFSNLILYPWGHCTDCQTPDHEFIVYHGDEMAVMTNYENIQSSDLYPTTGDFCDWHYGVYNSYCYTMEIGGSDDGFHPHPDKIDHIAALNMGPTFYMVEVSDDPAFRAVFGLGMDQVQWMQSPENITIPEEGDIPVELCLHPNFPLTNDVNLSHVMYRQVTPTRVQNDYGPTEWNELQPWAMSGFDQTTIRCELLDGTNGTTVIANIPVPETSVGEIHYRAMLGTTNGAFPISYPAEGQEPGDYYVLYLPYRAGFGSAVLAFMMFILIASVVWGGLGFTLREMFRDRGDDEPPDQTSIVESSMQSEDIDSIQDYGRMTVAELKVILSERGMSTSGRKAELIDRLKGA
ncbi:MAG: Carboxypeptidase T [Methanobacteriota archaeon]|nr:MAG: Carboxypeptidase T [Euryarchaeota archaeon]